MHISPWSEVRPSVSKMLVNRIYELYLPKISSTPKKES